ncbi:hypothetical protein sscle_10g079380 [Sclerotinia sclerotiorum 1980 UF-70]|uniref:Uncharacterized protein n=1 Tax=Sclerotinia sclerotiorum (strain ATCC 18683 / 1980 / Ss-1) TaxID=665079 RepID=A0A1D9QE54_SCLS1|nr:hypothetical protein sscle_10g079380 [Sclerotinia sclerotiorum 1980 UF-70]
MHDAHSNFPSIHHIKTLKIIVILAGSKDMALRGHVLYFDFFVSLMGVADFSERCHITALEGIVKVAAHIMSPCNPGGSLGNTIGLRMSVARPGVNLSKHFS